MIRAVIVVFDIRIPRSKPLAYSCLVSPTRQPPLLADIYLSCLYIRAFPCQPSQSSLYFLINSLIISEVAHTHFPLHPPLPFNLVNIYVSLPFINIVLLH